MKELTNYPQPQMPRFNSWRYLAMVTMLFFVISLFPLAWFFYQLVNSNINVAEFYLLSDDDKGEQVAALSAKLTELKADTARMGRKIRLLEQTATETVVVSNKGQNTLPKIKAFGRKQTEFTSYGAWATEGLRYYRNQINALYRAQGSKYQIE